MSSIDRVREFHQAFGHPINEKPTVPSFELRALRVRLIAEELIEFARASGIGLTLDTFNGEATISPQDQPDFRHMIDMVEAADGLGDLDYVVNGACLVWGFPAEEIYTEVHRSNMSKLGANGKPIYRQDKKVLKGPNFTPPDIAAVLWYAAKKNE